MEKLDFHYSTDKAGVYYDEKVIVTNGIKADIKTFTKIEGSSQHYRDKHFVYYHGKRVPDSDVKIFEVLAIWPYSKDRRHLYYENHMIDFVDVKTLRILNPNWAVDKNHVYHLYYDLRWLPEDLKKLIDSRMDAKTFELLDEGWHVKDKNAVYYANDIILGADPKTFKIVGQGLAEDKNSQYKYGNIVE